MTAAAASLIIAVLLAPCVAVVAALAWHNRRDINRLARRLGALEGDR